ncbi:MAG: acyl-CoA dehydrogenase family protein [Gemmatimonadaceae bacterium]|nr:acyl-CoA dehydrogenase family protein [Gemmatimonadaceae bacterium]
MNDQRPSFTRGLFAGAIHDDLVFPFPVSLEQVRPDEARLVRRLVTDLHALVGDVIDPAAIDEQATVPEPVIHAFAQIGLLGLTIPRAYGGLELSASAYARVFGEISRIDASLAVLVGVHCGLGAKAIVLFGSSEQKARYLPMLARGETLAAYALTEPDTGSDAQNITTRAVQHADGSWTLTGRKIWIGNGHRAGVIATFAQAAVERKGEVVQRPTAFIIRPDMPGFRVVGTVQKLGIRGSTQAELAFEQLSVPGDHVLGTVGKGFGVAVHVLNGGRLTLAAGCTAGAKALLGHMTEYAEHRVQFGRPIADFEITQRKLATLASEAYASDAMLGVLASLVDRGVADHSLEAACAKVFASDLIWRAADETVQVAGGRGFVKPYPYERFLRDARINRIFEGTNEILRLFIALNGVQGPAERLREIGSALRQPLRNLGLLSGYAASRIRSVMGATDTLDTTLHERLTKHRTFFEKHVAELRDRTEKAILQYRADIVERQFVLERLANMAIELYATACVLSRTQQCIEREGVEGSAHELALCDLFCVEAGRRFREARLQLDAPDQQVDDQRRAIAGVVRARDGYGVADAILDLAPAIERSSGPTG